MARHTKKIVKKVQPVQFEPDDIVFVKVRGYKIWPSQVKEVYREARKYCIAFFGTPGGLQIVRDIDVSPIGPVDGNPIATKHAQNEAFSEAWDFCRNMLLAQQMTRERNNQLALPAPVIQFESKVNEANPECRQHPKENGSTTGLVDTNSVVDGDRESKKGKRDEKVNDLVAVSSENCLTKKMTRARNQPVSSVTKFQSKVNEANPDCRQHPKENGSTAGLVDTNSVVDGDRESKKGKRDKKVNDLVAVSSENCLTKKMTRARNQPVSSVTKFQSKVNEANPDCRQHPKENGSTAGLVDTNSVAECAIKTKKRKHHKNVDDSHSNVRKQFKANSKTTADSEKTRKTSTQDESSKNNSKRACKAKN